MRTLVLTSVEARHAHLVKCLLEQRHNILAWAEEKGKSLNEEGFQAEHQTLISLHKDCLDEALAAYFPPLDLKGLPIVVYPRGIFRDTNLVSQAKAFAPEVVVSYGCGIVGEGLLSLSNHGMLGSHQGLPQYYRGSGANFFAFVNGQSAFMGGSLHFVNKGIDTGPVIVQQAPVPSAEDTYYSFSARLVNDTIQMYLSILDLIQHRSVDQVRSEAKPLPFVGRLYQRKDFTPAILRKGLQMQLQKSFSSWHTESLQACGPPIVL